MKHELHIVPEVMNEEASALAKSISENYKEFAI